MYVAKTLIGRLCQTLLYMYLTPSGGIFNRSPEPRQMLHVKSVQHAWNTISLSHKNMVTQPNNYLTSAYLMPLWSQNTHQTTITLQTILCNVSEVCNIEAILLYCCQNGPSCPGHFNKIRQYMAGVKKYCPKLFSTYFYPI